MDTYKGAKAMSYKDLIRSFQHVDSTSHTLDERSAKPRLLHLKKVNTRQNKENLPSKQHTQSLLQKQHQKSSWLDDDFLQQHRQQSKKRQQQLTYNKFITSLTGTMMQLMGTQPPDLLVAKITYLQFLSALEEILFIKRTYQPLPNDVVTGLWNELCGYGQTVGAFILLAAGILNMRSPQYQQSKYQHLWNKYAALRYTRLEQMGKAKTTNNEEEFPFSPRICQRSRDLLANRSRSKDQRQKNMTEKTFCQVQESIDSHSQTSQSKQLFDSNAGNRRSEILYKMAKERSLQKRRDKRSCDVEYEKSIAELTFHPKIHLKKKQKLTKTAIQGQQDSINRMIRGRVEREVRRIIHQKGLPYNEKMFQRMKKERYNMLIKARTINLCKKESKNVMKQTQERGNEQSAVKPAIKEEQTTQKESTKGQPLVLSIEVDEGRCQKLIIHEGECYKQAAAKFIAQLKLDADLYSKLVEGVEHALKFQLTQIDQDSFESSCESL